MSDSANTGSEEFIELPGNIRVCVSPYRGLYYVSIRKYYDPGTGQMLPGKQGINMNLQQWNEFSAKWEDVKALVDRNVPKDAKAKVDETFPIE